MLISLSDRIKKLAFMVGDDYSGDSPYLNIPIYQQHIDPSDTKDVVQNGPPSMYNDVDKDDRLQVVEDIRRQGERPDPVDWMDYNSRPVMDTTPTGHFENTQGEPMNDSTTSDGLNENRDTIGFNPGQLDVNQSWE